MAKSIYQVAATFEKKLRRLASFSNFPDSETVAQIVNRVLKNNSQLVQGFKELGNVDVQNAIDNTSSVYIQLVFEPNRYEQLISEPDRSSLVNTLQPQIEQALKSQFGAFNFRIKLGFVPL